MGPRPSSRSTDRWPGLPTATASFLGAASFLVLVLAAAVVTAGEVVQQVRTWTGPEKTRIVLDLSGPTPYRAERRGGSLLILLPDAASVREETRHLDDGRVGALTRRVGPGGAELEIALVGTASCRHFALPAGEGRPARIVVDVRPGVPATAAEIPAPLAVAVAAPPETLVVAIDAGHGGQDPGAIRDGVREKDVVLDIARRLAELVDAEPRLRAVLTRSDDRDVKLEERVRLAEAAGADLFVSIHANSSDRAATRGLEVYFLDEARAEEREGRALKDPRGAAGLLGLDEQTADDTVLPILMDLRQVSVVDRSRGLAERILAAARRSDTLDARVVKQGGYHVLRSLAMPSALVETAYLTNPRDRALLADPAGRREVARILGEGIRDFVAAERGEPVASLLSWSTWYEVRRGDNLWDLARRHGTSVREILERNHMDSDRLAVGQTLTLP